MTIGTRHRECPGARIARARVEDVLRSCDVGPDLPSVGLPPLQPPHRQHRRLDADPLRDPFPEDLPDQVLRDRAGRLRRPGKLVRPRGGGPVLDAEVRRRSQLRTLQLGSPLRITRCGLGGPFRLTRWEGVSRGVAEAVAPCAVGRRLSARFEYHANGTRG